MLRKLSRDAFEVVSYLFKTLDQSLTKNIFKYCWPTFDKRSHTEFQKPCFEWFKKFLLNVEVAFLKLVVQCSFLLVVLSLFI